MEIIKHCENFDVDEMLAGFGGKWHLNLDRHDYDAFLSSGDEAHIFAGAASGENRVRAALDAALNAGDISGLLDRAQSVLLALFYSSKAEKPIDMTELKAMSEFTDAINKDARIKFGWGVCDNPDSDVKVVLMINVSK